ncbi:MAG: cytochrome c oxidase subunit II [Bacteroidetes bacterium]|nr:MAG: cytochrome c oxidase subunit II [Bacteroidota bacterium]REK03467.1 MAG: cytochrome c oxidase subunit II [Bacteroidota bacterium]REK34772.1 MAG: cytochrome c oxidase subunit II [Bacteroidota bacterium]REK51349.1 MAG: cytochrome c oxidase subunit II [Bacteroidota bacterium]
MIKLLTLLVIVFALITIWRIIRVLELVRDLRGEEEEEITDKDNKLNGLLSMIFLFVGFAGMIYFTIDAKKYLLPVAASKHGVLTDEYLNLNFILIIIVFFITQTLLFYYAWKYSYKKNVKAFFWPDNHKLEFIWTVVPAVVLMGLIVYGLKLWINITAPAPQEAMVIEVYGKQFDWTARYSGSDNKLGHSNFRLITDDNILGVDVNDSAAADDKIARELYLPVGGKIVFKFHSRDVIHSAYFPHLRAQMNTVPGMTTEFFLEPTITTDSMRLITGNPKFDYILLCNKICGVAHYNMKMKVVVTTPEDFKKWYKEQKYVFAKPEAASATSDTLQTALLPESSATLVAAK